MENVYNRKQLAGEYKLDRPREFLSLGRSQAWQMTEQRHLCTCSQFPKHLLWFHEKEAWERVGLRQGSIILDSQGGATAKFGRFMGKRREGKNRLRKRMPYDSCILNRIDFSTSALDHDHGGTMGEPETTERDLCVPEFNGLSWQGNRQ